MCGFVCQFRFDSAPIEKDRLRASIQDIHHRGPDDEGIAVGDWFGLGFKRLAIIDTGSSGHQPMYDPTKRFVMVFNGELYNYRELKKELQQQGVAFQSHSDSEVILQAYLNWGEACLAKFEGMFAFCIVDTVKNAAFVARDQLGIKPLYVYRDKSQMVLASEVKALRKYTSFSLNHEALYEQFKFRYVAGERTLFREINRVQEGSSLTIQANGTVASRRYYNVLDSLTDKPSNSLSLKELESELHRSISMHTVSDVGYNIQLSGGIDSSYVTAVLAKASDRSLDTFSIEIPGDKNDESHFQQIVSEAYGTRHHRFQHNGDAYLSLLERATWHLDFPVVHSGTPFLMQLCHHSHSNSKVMLTGEGADEIFGGYSRYYLPAKERLAFQLKKLGVKAQHIPNLPKLRGLKALLSRDLGIDALTYDSNVGDLVSAERSIDFRIDTAARFSSLLEQISASDQVCYLATLLERQDKISMAESVETRVPFCTARLFDLINRSFSLEQRINPLPKALLKKLSEKYFDRSFVYRKKNGFKLPFRDWLKDRNGFGQALDLLSDDTFCQRGFYNQQTIERCIKEHLAGDADRTNQLFEVIRFEIWHRHFID